MLRRAGILGEGMQQDRNRGRERGCMTPMRTVFVRAALATALAGFVVGVDAPAARAQTYGSDGGGGGWNKFMQSMGLQKSPDADFDINYTERSPLVVPPT